MSAPTQTRAYRNGELIAEGFTLDELSEQLEDDSTVVWVDLCRPSTGQLQLLATELGLHELAVEDALGNRQRPKLDQYESHVFLACHAVELGDCPGRMTEHEVDTFIGKRWIVTVHKNDAAIINEVVARWDRSPTLAVHGVSFLLWGLLDVVVDGYFEAVDRLDAFYDEMSEGIFEDRPLDRSRQREWFEARQALVHFHRMVVPMREAVSSVMRRERELVPEAIYPYYQDVYDHVLRVTESTDALRDLVATIVETNLSLRDYRQNQVMKKVTSWAAIVAVPTLITGFYGMNVPYPGYALTWGVWASLVLMVVVSAGLFVTFRRRDWL
ncbi:MAG: magnesium transporter CorA family protein [Microthrixaceae bacterium]|nr:magnesium transporter CorA family protein [Microthrixaceae bacterium]